MHIIHYPFRAADRAEYEREAAIDEARHRKAILDHTFSVLADGLAGLRKADVSDDTLWDVAAGVLDGAEDACGQFNAALDEVSALGVVTLDVSPLVPWRRFVAGRLELAQARKMMEA